MVKNSSKKKCLSNYPKMFFKVFLPHHSSHLMKFPPAFLKSFRGNIPSKSEIFSHMGRSWKVDMIEVDGSLYFQKGWEQFVHDNSLDLGDFLVFSYDGKAKFCVTIYGPNGCEKKTLCHIVKSYQELSKPSKNHIAEKRGPKRLDSATNSKHFMKDDKDVKKASDFKSDFPFFRIVMKPSYVQRGCLNVPGSFIKRYMSHIISKKHGITLVYSDKSWPVKLSSVTKFSAGWIRFSKDNALEVGDICVFELINSNDCALKVSVFRCLG